MFSRAVQSKFGLYGPEDKVPEGSFERSVTIYQSSLCNILQDLNHTRTQPTHSKTYLRNTTYCYSTYQHEAITSRSRQLLMMDTWLPETC